MQLLNEVVTNFSSILNTISLFDLIDIGIVTLLIYNGALLIKDSRAAKIAKGIAALFVVYVIAVGVGLKTIGFLLNGMVQFGVIALLLVFQPELRRLLEGIGNKGLWNYIHMFRKTGNGGDNEKIIKTIHEIVGAVETMAASKTGALIVMENNIDLADIQRTGTRLDAVVKEELLRAIFYHNAPLHDGAVLIRENRVVSAGCFLPLSQNNTISKTLGTRHRASLGISESSDAFVIVVSEETGKISIAKNGTLQRELTKEKLRAMLMDELLYEKVEEKHKPKDSNGAEQAVAEADRKKSLQGKEAFELLGASEYIDEIFNTLIEQEEEEDGS